MIPAGQLPAPRLVGVVLQPFYNRPRGLATRKDSRDTMPIVK
jgi:hypothetical protein